MNQFPESLARTVVCVMEQHYQQAGDWSYTAEKLMRTRAIAGPRGSAFPSFADRYCELSFFTLSPAILSHTTSTEPVLAETRAFRMTWCPSWPLENRTGQRFIGLGLRGMKERLGQLGGRLEISSIEHGVTVIARLPASDSSADSAEVAIETP